MSDRISIRPRISVTAVKADIEAALRRRANADARSIAVVVNGTEVTLTGSAHSWSERELATDTAWAMPGVANVVNHIEVTY